VPEQPAQAAVTPSFSSLPQQPRQAGADIQIANHDIVDSMLLLIIE
jgi:hypothetical protein